MGLALKRLTLQGLAIFFYSKLKFWILIEVSQSDITKFMLTYWKYFHNTHRDMQLFQLFLVLNSEQFQEVCCRIWSWSHMFCEKHGLRDSVDTTEAEGQFLMRSSQGYFSINSCIQMNLFQNMYKKHIIAWIICNIHTQFHNIKCTWWQMNSKGNCNFTIHTHIHPISKCSNWHKLSITVLNFLMLIMILTIFAINMPIPNTPCNVTKYHHTSCIQSNQEWQMGKCLIYPSRDFPFLQLSQSLPHMSFIHYAS